VSYLQCPECRMTVPAAAYYLRGDECPRCLRAMEPLQRVRRQTSRGAMTQGTPLALPEEDPRPSA
jgi:hypothetical protein